MKTNNILTKAILAIAGVALSSSAAMAANPTFVAGDLVVYFQQRGGANTLMLDVGAATTFRDTTSNILNIANIGSLLSDGTNGFGSAWYDNSTVYWGAAGVRSASTNATAVTNGDPNRTDYVSQARTTVGTEGTAGSVGWAGFSASNLTTASTNILAQNNRLGTIPTSATNVLVETTSLSNVDNQNPFLGNNPGTAFATFAGGVESSFSTGTFGTLGGVAAESALDLYRILAATPAGTVNPTNANIGDGTYNGSFVIDNGGNVSFIVAPVPEPTTMGATLVLGLVAGAMRRRRQVTA